MNANDTLTRTSTTPVRGPELRTGAAGRSLLRAKGIALGMRLFNVWVRLRHRLSFGMRIHHVDHITIPCNDLAVAEAFYVGLLGARVMMRVDREFLRRMGREHDAAAGAVHTSVVFDRGSRLDLFVQPDGAPSASAGHPHYAFHVSAREMLHWKARLNARGVPTFGPTRLGPPSQASLYFNDPSGNHLELVTVGFVPDLPVGPPDMATLRYEWRPA
jgi:catechol 2,3-dioxygenase-like lactoylglutathione lyase family enzyme